MSLNNSQKKGLICIKPHPYASCLLQGRVPPSTTDRQLEKETSRDQNEWGSVMHGTHHFHLTGLHTEDATGEKTKTKKTKLRDLSPRANYTDRRLPSKLVPTSADRRCRVVSATDPHGHILGFLDRGRYYLFQVAPQLYSRG
jgi:hypothetical protein